MNVKIAQMQGGKQILYMVIRYILAFPIGKKTIKKGRISRNHASPAGPFAGLALKVVLPPN